MIPPSAASTPPSAPLAPSGPVPSLPLRRLGDRTVSAIGLGCMPLSDGRMVAERKRAMATVHAALDAGVTLLDTANVYAPAWDQVGHNEALVAQALRSWAASSQDRDRVLVTTKGGIVRGPGETWGRDASPDGLRRACEASLRTLGVDVIDLYQLHRLDPARPVVDQIGALLALQQDGLVRMVGVSNVNGAEWAVAVEVAGTPGEPDGPDAGRGLVSVQNEFSPRYRADADVLHAAADAGVAFLPWSPLGGASEAAAVGSRYAAVADVAQAHGVSPQRVVLAWLLAQSPSVVPIPGSTRPATVLDSVAAASLELTSDELARVDATAGEPDSMFPDDMPRPPLR
jgi:aryl-alcohol dehydrogenase-like predicted oxidoreductase